MSDNASGVYLVVPVPFGIAVDGECLGRASPSKIGGVPVSIILPTLRRREGDSTSYVAHPPEIPGLHADIDWSRQLDSLFPWVTAVYWRAQSPFGPGDVASVSHLLAHAATSDEEAPEEVGQVLQSKGTDWMHSVGDWLEVTTGTWLRRPEQHGERILRIGHREVWSFDGHRAVGLQPPPMTIVVSVGGYEGVALETWRMALRMAGSGQAPPTEHILLRDARGSLAQGAYRRSVLDAATAAEIAEATLLDRLTQSASAGIAKAIRDANRDLSRLSSILRTAFGVSIPTSTQTGLIVPRNTAIHAGANPTESEARTAIALATEIVELATPASALTT